MPRNPLHERLIARARDQHQLLFVVTRRVDPENPSPEPIEARFEKAGVGGVAQDQICIGRKDWAGDDYISDAWPDGSSALLDSPDPETELCLIAHEIGHKLEDLADWEELIDIDRRARSLERSIDRTEKERLLASERRAWELGRRELTTLGCTIWAKFEEVRLAGLRSYEEIDCDRSGADR